MWRMYTHAPKDYECPFCNFLKGNETDFNQKQDIVYQNHYVTAFVAPKWWVNNPGHVLVIPNKHFENITTLPMNTYLRYIRLLKK